MRKNNFQRNGAKARSRKEEMMALRLCTFAMPSPNLNSICDDFGLRWQIPQLREATPLSGGQGGLNIPSVWRGRKRRGTSLPAAVQNYLVAVPPRHACPLHPNDNHSRPDC